jgi:hypothetical protein
MRTMYVSGQIKDYISLYKVFLGSHTWYQIYHMANTFQHGWSWDYSIYLICCCECTSHQISQISKLVRCTQLTYADDNTKCKFQ